MPKEVKIEQVQKINGETIESSFEGKIVNEETDLFKIIYQNENRLHCLIIQKISDTEISFGTLLQMNKLKLNEIRNVKYEVDGHFMEFACRLTKFSFNESLIEIQYDLLIDKEIVSHHILKITSFFE